MRFTWDPLGWAGRIFLPVPGDGVLVDGGGVLVIGDGVLVDGGVTWVVVGGVLADDDGVFVRDACVLVAGGGV